jgi:hypothetical protein
MAGFQASTEALELDGPRSSGLKPFCAESRLRAPAGAGHSIATSASPQNHACTSYPRGELALIRSSRAKASAGQP